MAYTAKNYNPDPDTTVINGKLIIGEDAEIEGLPSTQAATETTAGVVKVAANQAASTATDVAGLVTDFNALLTKLKAAGLMTADATA